MWFMTYFKQDQRNNLSFNNHYHTIFSKISSHRNWPDFSSLYWLNTATTIYVNIASCWHIALFFWGHAQPTLKMDTRYTSQPSCISKLTVKGTVYSIQEKAKYLPDFFSFFFFLLLIMCGIWNWSSLWHQKDWLCTFASSGNLKGIFFISCDVCFLGQYNREWQERWEGETEHTSWSVLDHILSAWHVKQPTDLM